jgi:hypothetical protein
MIIQTDYGLDNLFDGPAVPIEIGFVLTGPHTIPSVIFQLVKALHRHGSKAHTQTILDVDTFLRGKGTKSETDVYLNLLVELDALAHEQNLEFGFHENEQNVYGFGFWPIGTVETGEELEEQS